MTDAALSMLTAINYGAQLRGRGGGQVYGKATRWECIGPFVWSAIRL